VIEKMPKKILVKTTPNMRSYKKLNIGCDNVLFKDDWLNIDQEFKKATNYLQLDITQKFPFTNTDLIYSERFIEKLTKPQAIDFIQNCYKALVEGGILRIATFDLSELIDNCHSMNDNWKESCEADRLGLAHLTKCEYLNMAFRGWNHQYVYDADELKSIFIKGGFTNIRQYEINESEHPDLCNRERQFNSYLVIEGVKSA
jgi:predicted SAM-dependent methyltransferase